VVGCLAREAAFHVEVHVAVHAFPEGTLLERRQGLLEIQVGPVAVGTSDQLTLQQVIIGGNDELEGLDTVGNSATIGVVTAVLGRSSVRHRINP
jgi:serine acetyltransferase